MSKISIPRFTRYEDREYMCTLKNSILTNCGLSLLKVIVAEKCVW